jgi:D-glycero-D-manno-heptose 1,7-bisphosphate phosphatase
MIGEFKKQNVEIDKVYFCPSHPEHGIGKYKVDSPNRKPNPGMILQAKKEFDIDLARSILIGDKESDIQAGIAAGVAVNVLFDRNIFNNNFVHTSANQVIHGLLDFLI